MLSGVGGTGKDYLALEVQRRAKENSVVILKSPTRQAYEDYGIRTEAQALALKGRAFAAFQSYLHDAFRLWMGEQTKLIRKSGDTLFIIPRTSIDYVSYQSALVDPESLDRKGLMKKLAIDLQRLQELNAQVLLMPWPTPWYGPGTKDGVREVKFEKDQKIACELEHTWKHSGYAKAHHVTSMDLEDRVKQVQSLFKETLSFAE